MLAYIWDKKDVLTKDVSLEASANKLFKTIHCKYRVLWLQILLTIIAPIFYNDCKYFNDDIFDDDCKYFDDDCKYFW